MPKRRKPRKHNLSLATTKGNVMSAPVLKPNADLARRVREIRFNPLRIATPTYLANALDAFHAGYLREAAYLWDIIEERDDMAKTAIPKRKKSVSRRPWEIVVMEDTPAAQAHKEKLEAFFDNITVTDATDLNVKGGMRLLIKQMMNAQFQKYAVHEIIWKPGVDLRAELKYCPLWLFENRRGRLGYIGAEYLTEGTLLDDDGWMITCGDGLMEAISVCWMFKRLSLQDWMNFSEKFGVPGIHGETPAAKGSPEWDAFVDSLENFANDWVTATTTGAKINLIEVGKTGDAPFAPMVERMDRSIAALCRGADLSTLSRDNGAGASLQGDEANMLEEDDCELMSEVINLHLTRQIIAYFFGTEPLAYFQLTPPTNQNVEQDIKVDKHLKEMGVPQSKQDIAERYNRTLPDDDEELVGQPAEAAPAALPNAQPANGDHAFLDAAQALLANARVEDMEPLRAELAEIIAIENAQEQDRRLAEFVTATLPDAITLDARQAEAWRTIFASSLFNGLNEA